MCGRHAGRKRGFIIGIGVIGIDRRVTGTERVRAGVRGDHRAACVHKAGADYFVAQVNHWQIRGDRYLVTRRRDLAVANDENARRERRGLRRCRGVDRLGADDVRVGFGAGRLRLGGNRRRARQRRNHPGKYRKRPLRGASASRRCASNWLAPARRRCSPVSACEWRYPPHPRPYPQSGAEKSSRHFLSPTGSGVSSRWSRTSFSRT